MRQKDIEDKVASEQNERTSEELKSEVEVLREEMPKMPEEAVKVISNLPEEDRNVVVAAVKKVSFSGPVPPPELLARYESISPGMADRLVKMAESQMNHRIETEKCVVKGSLKQETLGKIIGGVLAVVCVGATVVLGLNGHDSLAKLIGTTTVISIVSIYVIGQIPEFFKLKNNKDQKNQ